MILLDTSVLSRALRRKQSPPADPIAAQPVRHSFGRTKLEPFPTILAPMADHHHAAEIVNRCRSKGFAAGTIDALIAALAIRRNASLFTVDADFSRIAEVVALKLLPPV